MVVAIDAWPSNSWMTLSGTPRIARCEANEMAQRVPPDLPQPGTLERPLERPRQQPRGERLARGIAEHERSTLMPVRRARLDHLVAEREPFPFGRCDQSIRVVEVQEVKLRWRDLDPVDLRHRGDQPPLPGHAEHVAHVDQEVVNRLGTQETIQAFHGVAEK